MKVDVIWEKEMIIPTNLDQRKVHNLDFYIENLAQKNDPRFLEPAQANLGVYRRNIIYPSLSYLKNVWATMKVKLVHYVDHACSCIYT